MILHYNEISLTRKAVESVKALDIKQHEAEIVVVDNGSPNKTGKALLKEYDGDDKVHVILTGENGGFSKGNNVGFSYIKNELYQDAAPDFVIALNNDITFPQRDFLQRLADVYEKSSPRFYVAGPDVFTPHIRSHISPLSKCVRGKSEAQEAIDVLVNVNEGFKKGFSFANYSRYLQEKYQGTGILNFYNSLRKGEYDGATPHNQPAYDCVLNGACLIFDRRYVEEYDVLFEEKTFLYVEEDFLTKRLTDVNKSIRYCPELVVSHVGQGSSGFKGMNYREYVKKNICTNEKVIDSWKIYIEYVDRL